MKKIFGLILAIVTIVTVSTSCSDEKDYLTGNGKVSISLSIDEETYNAIHNLSIKKEPT